MRQKNVNRLVWNNGFTNDRQASQNKEAYKKKCNNCMKQIWLNPDGDGWNSLDLDGKPHKCKKKVKQKKEPKHYIKKCKFCGVEVLVMLMNNKKWVVFDESRTKHRCNNAAVTTPNHARQLYDGDDAPWE